MRASAVQLNSNEDKARNVEIAERLVRQAAREGSELVVLPEKFNVIGSPEQLIAGAEALDGPTLRWAGALAGELGLWLVAGSIVERVEGDDKLRNTSVLYDPDGVVRAIYRKIHMFDVEVGGVTYRESDAEAPGEEIVVADADSLKLGLAVCYDLRFPELFRIMAVDGAQAFSLPSAFTVPTGRAHWEILIRARAIENQAFVIAAGQVGRHPPDHESFGHSMIVDAWGTVLAAAADEPERVVVADIDLDAQAQVRAKLPSLANRRPGAYRGLEAAARWQPRNANAVDKRRMILDAAIRVFAREGFHRCRVSAIANEAGVAYGLVYHYFRSKDEVLDTLFTERWTLLLEAIADVDARELPIREKLQAIAAFIIDSYRNDPDLMKVIIVEVTRAANTFGRAHLDEISQAYEGIAEIIRKAQDAGELRSDFSPEFATLCFYGAIEQLLTAWIFEAIPATPDTFEQAKQMVVETVCGGLEVRV